MFGVVAIHNKNGQGLLLETQSPATFILNVAIHNKNGQGLLQWGVQLLLIKLSIVAIHNKNGQGLLLDVQKLRIKCPANCRNPQ